MNIIGFGASYSETRSLFGEPSEIINANFDDGVSSKIWIYQKFGLELYFDSVHNRVLCGLNVLSKEASLDGYIPVGLNKLELLCKYPGLKLSCKDGVYKEF